MHLIPPCWNCIISQQKEKYKYYLITETKVVDEVLSDGSTVRLTLDNYDKVNEKIKAPVKKEEEPKFEMPEEEPKVEQPKEEKKPQVSNKQEAKQNNNQNNNNKKNKER